MSDKPTLENGTPPISPSAASTTAPSECSPTAQPAAPPLRSKLDRRALPRAEGTGSHVVALCSREGLLALVLRELALGFGDAATVSTDG